jgi:DNA-binding XRE family transcriptional regulator
MEAKMKNNYLSNLPPESMDLEVLLDWVRNRAQESNSLCQEAKVYYDQLGKYHADIAQLMAELSQLKNENSREATEEAKNIVETVWEVFQAIHTLQTKEGLPSEDSQNLDEIEKELLSNQKGKMARESNQREANFFLEKYNHHKARLGLLTQEDVSKLTGLDRRQISVLEQGKHKPQFKTIKRIADAFGVPVKEFMG